jgi:phosphohistidine phosphatase
MKEIWLMRHAKSDWSDPMLADVDRPLNKRGKKDAPRMGRWLASSGHRPDLVVSSPAVRAQLTARAVVEELGLGLELYRTWPEFYPGSVWQTLEYLKALPEDLASVLLIGHNPVMEDLVCQLTAEISPHIRMPTAAVALLVGEMTNWNMLQTGAFVLKQLVTPKSLKK